MKELFTLCLFTMTIFIKKKKIWKIRSLYPGPLIELKNVILSKIFSPGPGSRWDIYFNHERFLELYPCLYPVQFPNYLGAVPGTGRKTLRYVLRFFSPKNTENDLYISKIKRTKVLTLSFVKQSGFPKFVLKGFKRSLGV